MYECMQTESLRTQGLMKLIVDRDSGVRESAAHAVQRIIERVLPSTRYGTVLGIYFRRTFEMY